MKSSKKNLIAIAVVILIIAVLGILSIYVDKIPSPSTYATFWALVPSVVAITLALITKEVYSSLFIGIVIGSVFASGFSFTGSISNVLQDGLIAFRLLQRRYTYFPCDPWNNSCAYEQSRRIKGVWRLGSYAYQDQTGSTALYSASGRAYIY